MKVGDLATTVIKKELVILLKKEAKQVWKVLRNNGQVTSEWALNLVPYELKI